MCNSTYLETCTSAAIFPSSCSNHLSLPFYCVSVTMELPAFFTFTKECIQMCQDTYPFRAIGIPWPLAARMTLPSELQHDFAGLTSSIVVSYQFFCKSTQELQQLLRRFLPLRANRLTGPPQVLQHWHGSDSLTTERDDLCLFLGEECCFYINQV